VRSAHGGMAVLRWGGGCWWGDGVRVFGRGCGLALLALLDALFGLLEAIRCALEGDESGMVDQAIDQGDGAGCVGKDLAP